MHRSTPTWLWLLPCALALAAFASGFAAQSAELQTLRNQGKARFEEQDFGGAVAAFLRAAEQPDAGPQDYINLAAAQYRNGEDAAALATLDAHSDALQGHPGDPFLRGLIARRAGDLEGAAAAFEAARALDPTDAAIRFHGGAVYAQLGRQDEALAEFEAVIDMGFDVGVQHYVSSVYQTMQLLLRQGRREEAQPLVETYREHNGQLTPAERAPGALDLSRWSAITVPTASVQPATPDTAERVRLLPASADIPIPDGGRVAVADLDLDGAQDLIIGGPQGSVRLARGDGFLEIPRATPAGPLGVGDFDRDGRPDLYVAAAAGDRLYRNVAQAEGIALLPVDTELPAGGSPSSVLWVDFDHDGDLDVLVTHGAADGTAGAARLLRNQGSNVFTDVTTTAGFESPRADTGALFADFDADFDVDLLFWGADGTTLYSNLRNGLFDEITTAVGAGFDGRVHALVAEDLDNDGLVDLALATDNGIVVRRNLPGGTFQPVSADSLTGDPVEALAAGDLNNDGFLDLIGAVDGALRFWSNVGGFRFGSFDPITDGVADAGAVTRLLAADADGNGGVDVVVARDEALSLLAQPAPLGDWLAVALTGEKNNLQGVGATVEVKAGGSYQLRPLRRTPLHFGVGDHDVVEVVRIRWPNGIIQNLLDAATGRLHAVTELERLEGSCPFLYTWDGERFRFINEVLGSSPLGMLLAEGVYHLPDGDEYVLVRGEQMRARDGYYQISITEELRETAYIDALRVLAIDHPVDLSILPDEGFGGLPRPDFRLHLFDELAPVRVRDQNGRDWSAELAAVDGSWAVPFAPAAYDGLATPHALTVELPEAGARPAAPVKLHLTGWVYWSMGSTNLAVDQDPSVEFLPVTLEVPDGSGGWRVAIEDIGLPIAKNSTLVVDVTDVLDRSDPRVRLSTTMRLYWDRMAYSVGGQFAAGAVPAGDWQREHGVPRVGDLAMQLAAGAAQGGDEAAPLRVEVLAPASADLRARGFSAVDRTPEGYETFDYQTVRADAPWEQHRGHFTRFGDVTELLQAADDRYVVLATGDEIAVRVAASDRPLPEGWRRDYLVYLNGWLKDTDVNSMYGKRTTPLPFQGMSAYPYPASEGYPDDREHRAFLEQYLTRPPRPINPPLIGGR